MFTPDVLRAALDELGRLLEVRGHTFEVVIVGGSALLLAGWIERPTIDVDVVAFAGETGLTKARPFPAALEQAIEDIAAVRGLPPGWMNAGPTDLLDWGMPEGFADRLDRRDFGGLTVFVAGRLDLICMKLYAVVDQGPTGRHIDDLRALHPTAEELEFAAAWCRSQDPSPAFAQVLSEAVRFLSSGQVDDSA